MFKYIFNRRWRNPRGNLYYAILNTPDGPLYKLGYTQSHSLRNRFWDEVQASPDFIQKELHFREYEDAFRKEYVLHQFFKNQRAYPYWFSKRGKPLYRCGQSELYRTDILGLDEELYLPRTVEEKIPVFADVAPSATANWGPIDYILMWVIVVVTAVTLVGLIVAIPLGIYLLAEMGTSAEARTSPVPERWETVQKIIPGLERPQHPEHIQAIINEMLAPEPLLAIPMTTSVSRAR